MYAFCIPPIPMLVILPIILHLAPITNQTSEEDISTRINFPFIMGPKF